MLRIPDIAPAMTHRSVIDMSRVAAMPVDAGKYRHLLEILEQ
jgi:hypothetical protein